jgi:Predicted membrane protein
MENMMAATAQSLSQRFDVADRLLFGISLICGIAYLLTRGLPVFPGSVVIKGLSVSPLAWIAFRQLVGSDRLLLAGALLLSALGDVFLGLGGEQWFVYGLSSFLIAHVFYIALFVRQWPHPPAASAPRRVVAALLIVFAAAMFAGLWPSLGEMKLPVAAYMCALTGMSLTATLADFRAWWVVIGAALFVLSDSLIAVGKFMSPIAYSDYIIWATYYTAQVFIALGFILEKRRA